MTPTGRLRLEPTVKNCRRLFWASACGSSPGGATGVAAKATTFFFTEPLGYAVGGGGAPASGAVELPGNPIWVFEGDVAFSKRLVQLDPGILNAGGFEGLRYAVELAFVCTSKGDVIQTDS